MSEIELVPAPLTHEAFAPYGDVIEAGAVDAAAMNAGRFERFDLLGTANAEGGRIAFGITRCVDVTELPYRFDVVERHPLGSQAFIPLDGSWFTVVVAPPGDEVVAEDLRAFVTNGRQGVNYHRGTWHMPLIALTAGQEFLVVDRFGEEPNCDVRKLETALVLHGAG